MRGRLWRRYENRGPSSVRSDSGAVTGVRDCICDLKNLKNFRIILKFIHDSIYLDLSNEMLQ